MELKPKENRVVVGAPEELLRREVPLSDMYWSVMGPNDPPMRVRAKIRYNMEARPAWLYGGDEPHLVFDDPVRAVTPGQFAVAYRGKTVVAGGTIA